MMINRGVFSAFQDSTKQSSLSVPPNGREGEGRGEVGCTASQSICLSAMRTSVWVAKHVLNRW